MEGRVMSEWAAKRFWAEARVTEAEGRFGVALDGRAVRTPAKAPLQMPTKAMAEAVAAEWDAQDGTIDPMSMPVTRSANAAVDKVGALRAEVIEMIAAYAEADMLCYRAERPESLVARQAEAWDPYIAWAREALGLNLQTTAGLIHVDQPAGTLQRASDLLAQESDFALAALHDLVSLSGSFVLGLAVARGRAGAKEIWPVSRLDELWQAEQWGADEEAESLAATKAEAFAHAERFLALARRDDAG